MQIDIHPDTATDEMVSTICHCLNVSESTVVDAIAGCGLTTVKEVARCTGAGSGCTACHSMIRQHLRNAAVRISVAN